MLVALSVAVLVSLVPAASARGEENQPELYQERSSLEQLQEPDPGPPLVLSPAKQLDEPEPRPPVMPDPTDSSLPPSLGVVGDHGDDSALSGAREDDDSELHTDNDDSALYAHKNADSAPYTQNGDSALYETLDDDSALYEISERKALNLMRVAFLNVLLRRRTALQDLEDELMKR